ncbi:hypothetical protein D3C71_1630960 [compost metagenome]
MALPTPLGSRPRPVFTSAAAPLIRPSARMKARGMRCPDTGKFSTARWVCAPHRASAGTCSSPMLSCSVRNPLLEPLLIINSALLSLGKGKLRLALGSLPRLAATATIRSGPGEGICGGRDSPVHRR